MEYVYSGKLSIINLLIWLLSIIAYAINSNNNSRHTSNYIFICLMVILFATFGFSEADTYHYHGYYDQMILYNSPIHVESFYFWLIKHLPHNYYLWRFVVWGAAALLMIGTFKRLNLNAEAVYLSFPILLLQQFTITRGCLGIALFLYSLTFLLKPASNKFLSLILGLCGCLLSLFLHRSLPLFIAISFLAIIPLNKTLIIISLIFFPILREGLIPYVFNIIGTGLFTSETEIFAQNYLEADKFVTNTNGILRICLDYLPRFLIFIFFIKEFDFTNKTIPKPIRFLFQYSYVLFYIALLFLGQSTSSFISSRTIHMMCFPLTIVLSYYITMNNKFPFMLKTALFFFFMSDLFDFIYSIYKWW